MFAPLFFPVKRFNKILDSNEEMRNDKKIILFLKQIIKLKISLFLGISCMILLIIIPFVSKSLGVDWVNVI